MVDQPTDSHHSSNGTRDYFLFSLLNLVINRSFLLKFRCVLCVNINLLDCTDVLETVEEAETQADLSDDAEQLREPQRKENVKNSTATGKPKTIYYMYYKWFGSHKII